MIIADEELHRPGDSLPLDLRGVRAICRNSVHFAKFSNGCIRARSSHLLPPTRQHSAVMTLSVPPWSARLWRGELPWSIHDRGIHGPTRLALELSRFSQASSYGLLGAELLAAGSPGTRAGGPAVDCLLTDGPELPGSPAGSYDCVRAGLDPEYAHAVIEGARWAARELGIDPARIRFPCAAHAAVQSSPSIFALLAASVVYLIARAPAENETAALAEALAWASGAQRFLWPRSAAESGGAANGGPE